MFGDPKALQRDSSDGTTGGHQAMAYVMGTEGAVALAAKQEGSSAWTDFLAVGAYHKALAHVQELPGLQHSECGKRLVPGTFLGVRAGSEESSSGVGGRMPSTQLQFQMALGTVRLAEAAAARTSGVHDRPAFCQYCIVQRLPAYE